MLSYACWHFNCITAKIHLSAMYIGDSLSCIGAWKFLSKVWRLISNSTDPFPWERWGLRGQDYTNWSCHLGMSVEDLNSSSPELVIKNNVIFFRDLTLLVSKILVTSTQPWQGDWCGWSILAIGKYYRVGHVHLIYNDHALCVYQYAATIPSHTNPGFGNLCNCSQNVLLACPRTVGNMGYG